MGAVKFGIGRASPDRWRAEAAGPGGGGRRFAEAIEQPGHEKVDVPPGAVYALEQIVRNAGDVHHGFAWEHDAPPLLRAGDGIGDLAWAPAHRRDRLLQRIGI